MRLEDADISAVTEREMFSHRRNAAFERVWHERIIFLLFI